MFFLTTPVEIRNEHHFVGQNIGINNRPVMRFRFSPLLVEHRRYPRGEAIRKRLRILMLFAYIAFICSFRRVGDCIHTLQQFHGIKILTAKHFQTSFESGIRVRSETPPWISAPIDCHPAARRWYGACGRLDII